jgi:DNA polymerase-3 subunit chi
MNKSEANFYKIIPDKFPKIFPRLLNSVVEKGNKLVILAENDDSVQKLDEMLWVYEQLSFLPHLTHKDELANESPIYITTSEADNANSANIIAIMSKSFELKSIGKYDKYLLFYNDDSARLAEMRAKKFIELGGVCNYIMQDATGAWVKTGKIT